jgi:hypothetical protein
MDVEALKREWYQENAPFGRVLGYPYCCILEFCDQPPALLQGVEPSQIDIDRYNAGYVDGEFTGFIPCAYHAGLILEGRISLASLIHGRNPAFPPFPITPNL